MLSIHYVSIMMWIFYIDWYQYWKCYWTMNIGVNRVNAHGKRTVSTKPATGDRLDSWAFRHWRGIELVFKSVDCFTVRPIFFSTRLITRIKSFSLFFFLNFTGGGGGGGGAQLQCIYYLVLYTDLKAAEGFRRFKRRSCYGLIWSISLISFGTTLLAATDYPLGAYKATPIDMCK